MMEFYECKGCLAEYVDFRRDRIMYRVVDAETSTDEWIPMMPSSNTNLPAGYCPLHAEPMKKFQALFSRDRDKILIFTDDRTRGLDGSK